MKHNLKMIQESIPAASIELEHFKEYALLALQNGQDSTTILTGKHVQEILKLHPSLLPRLEDEVMIMEATLMEMR